MSFSNLKSDPNRQDKRADFRAFLAVTEASKKALAMGEAPKKLLLHSCCAPCSSGMLEELTRCFAVTVFFCNPNITDASEYDKRLAEQKKLLNLFPKGMGCYPVHLIEGVYCPNEFEAFAKPLADCPEGGKRCEACFALRLTKTAQAAAEGGFDYFATTLTVSPLKNAMLINQIGQKAGAAAGVCYLPSDFKKRGGYLNSLQNSKKYGLYRQNYCGCAYSKREQEQRTAAKSAEPPIDKIAK